MAEACWPHRAVFITSMAAVAGAVAEAVLSDDSSRGAHEGLRERWRRHRDHSGAATSLAIGVVRSAGKAVPEGGVRIGYDMPVRGIATSGRHGTRFSLGIADAVTVLRPRCPFRPTLPRR